LTIKTSYLQQYVGWNGPASKGKPVTIVSSFKHGNCKSLHWAKVCHLSTGKMVKQQVISPPVLHGDDALSYHCAEKDNCNCAGDHDCIAMQMSMAWPGELQE